MLFELAQKGAKIGSYARSLIENPAFTTLPIPILIDLVIVEAGKLVPGKLKPTTEEIFDKADELGLDKVPAELGPHYRLAHMDQPKGGRVFMGTYPIVETDDRQHFFEVSNNNYGLWLERPWTPLSRERNSQDVFVFSLRK